MDAHDYSLELMADKGLQSSSTYDLQDLEALVQPLYDEICKRVYDYTLAHSRPGCSCDDCDEATCPNREGA